MSFNHHETTPLTADQTYAAVAARREILATEHHGLAEFGVQAADVHVAELPYGNTLVAIDETVQKQRVFKSISAAGNVAVLDKTVTEVVTGSAGSFMLALGEAGRQRDLQTTSFTPKPRLANPVKLEAARQDGITVVADSDTVEDALEAARQYAKATPGAAFVHPYDSLWGVAALTLVGDHAVDSVSKLRANGELPAGQTEAYWLQVGGGSLLGGVACRLYEEPDYQRTIHAVRPARLKSGLLNDRYDGLRVEVPGKTVAPLLEDRRFVQGRSLVGEAAVADATRLMHRVNPATRYEANALVGVAAALQAVADNPKATPRTHVVVLTGSNTDPVQHEYFMQHEGYEAVATANRERRQKQQEAEARWSRFVAYAGKPAVQETVNRIGTSVAIAASPTAAFRTGLVEPNRR